VCGGHPAVLCYAVGNEIPASIVRWHGRHRVERHIARLCRAAKDEDPQGVVTYVNYPTTEYLDLPFIDLVTFNIYLEHRKRLGAYLARLQNIAGDRPLLVAEVGLDSLRHGEGAQARSLEGQVRTVFSSGCTGAFVFAWTDEWHRAGHDVDDWAFGVTDRARSPKLALAAVRQAFANTPFPRDVSWPCISVVVCSFNGERTIRDTCEGLARLTYPDFEVIIVDDGSTDATAAIARGYGFRVISTENRGLASARNTGLQAAKGEIVAYIDDDAYPDPDWLRYLAHTFMSTDYAGVGGPNMAPSGDGLVADAVANAPGGPVHVLLSDSEAEHIPGCNMAFRRECIEDIGGFDSQFRSAGDDVDICWRLSESGRRIGFSPGAMVWHHARSSVHGYWKQQAGYGKAEALLERKWPDHYNTAGHITWSGRLYGQGVSRSLGWSRGRVYQGVWGSAPFQSIYRPAPNALAALAGMPEWYLVIAALAAFSILGFQWSPLLLAFPLLGLAVVASVAQALLGAARVSLTNAPYRGAAGICARALIAYLYLLQPLARLVGRVRNGLGPWRQPNRRRYGPPWPQTCSLWSERWQPADARLRALEAAIRDEGAVVLRGGAWDRWDLEARGGLLGTARLRMAVEEHQAGRQAVYFRSWPWFKPRALFGMALLAALAAGSLADQAWLTSAILGAGFLLVGLRSSQECSLAMGLIRAGIHELSARDASTPDAPVLRSKAAG
jgi:GT2 family glycosyltransferase